MNATCKICQQIITSPLVGDDWEKNSTAIGELILNHMAIHHKPYMENLLEINRLFNGFILMNRFSFDNEKMVEEVEQIRDKLCDRVMEDAPEMDNNEDEEDEDEQDKQELEEKVIEISPVKEVEAS